MPASPFDPLPRLEPGEDRFAIRENDPVGAQAITAWAHLRRNWLFKRYGTAPVGEAARILQAELAQCAEADEKALAWSERQRGHEAADEARATYSGAELSEEQVREAQRLKLADALKHHLSEADYCAHELLALDGPAASLPFAEQAERLHELATGMRYQRERVGA
jgi:hypothetical protein